MSFFGRGPGGSRESAQHQEHQQDPLVAGQYKPAVPGVDGRAGPRVRKNVQPRFYLLCKLHYNNQCPPKQTMNSWLENKKTAQTIGSYGNAKLLPDEEKEEIRHVVKRASSEGAAIDIATLYVKVTIVTKRRRPVSKVSVFRESMHCVRKP